MWIGKAVYTSYWLDELYEVFPEFQNVYLGRWRLGSFEELSECATANIFAQYITAFSLSPRTIEASHVLHRISAARVTQ